MTFTSHDLQQQKTATPTNKSFKSFTDFKWVRRVKGDSMVCGCWCPTQLFVRSTSCPTIVRNTRGLHYCLINSEISDKQTCATSLPFGAVVTLLVNHNGIEFLAFAATRTPFIKRVNVLNQANGALSSEKKWSTLPQTRPIPCKGVPK